MGYFFFDVLQNYTHRKKSAMAAVLLNRRKSVYIYAKNPPVPSETRAFQNVLNCTSPCIPDRLLRRINKNAKYLQILLRTDTSFSLKFVFRGKIHSFFFFFPVCFPRKNVVQGLGREIKYVYTL